MRKSEDLDKAGALASDVAAAESILEQLAEAFIWNTTEQGHGKETSAAKSGDSSNSEPLNLEARYRTLVEQIPAVVFMAYLDQGIGEAYVSPHIEALLGFTQEEWLNDPIRWYQQIHPDDKARWSLDAANMFLSGQALRAVYRVLARDGRVLWFQCEAKMVHRDDGSPWFIHGAAIDVTELKEADAELRRAHDELETRVRERTAELALTNKELQIEIAERKFAEEALRESEERYRTVAETASDAIITIDHNSEMLFVNPATEQIFGFTPDEMIGKDLTMLMPEYLRDLHRTGINRYYSTGERHITWQSVELIGLHKSGREVPIEVSFGEFIRGGERLFTGFVRDITKRKQAEAERAKLLQAEQRAREEAEAANRLKDEFLATVSHELRTPLTAVLGWACVLRMGRFGESSFDKALEAIERNARSQSQLIDDLLDVSRIIAGKLRLKMRVVDLHAVIESALDSIRPAAEAKEIRIITLLKPLPRTLSGDPDRLQQIVWNLLSNAVKFTPRQGQVQIQVEPHEEDVRIVVSDNGPGISQEFLPHVFDRFRQADGSFTREHGGLGLGLAIARHLVELHGGTIEATSDPGSEGSTFTVTLPLLQKESRESTNGSSEIVPSQAPSAGLPLSGLRILVVDDDPDALELLVLVFRQYGAEVVAASSAHEALTSYRRESFDVLISDIQMPDEDGYQLVRKISAIANERAARLTALAVTAHAKTEDRMRALEAGYHAHVPKPVDPSQLVLMLASLVNDTNGEPN